MPSTTSTSRNLLDLRPRGPFPPPLSRPLPTLPLPDNSTTHPSTRRCINNLTQKKTEIHRRQGRALGPPGPLLARRQVLEAAHRVQEAVRAAPDAAAATGSVDSVGERRRGVGSVAVFPSNPFKFFPFLCLKIKNSVLSKVQKSSARKLNRNLRKLMLSSAASCSRGARGGEAGGRQEGSRSVVI